MKIDANKRPIAEILSAGEHAIPRYQRRYAWNEQNITDYWNDITTSKGPHFLGSMVVSGDPMGQREVIDGQQRLTTTLIALAAIRNIYEELGQSDLVAGVKQYIEFVDRSGHHKYRLTNKDAAAENRLRDHVLLQPDKRLKKPEGVEAPRERLVYDQLYGLLQEELAQDRDPDKINRVRDAILEAEIVYIHVEERKNAFTIFETLNDRGQSLTVMDLTKNLLFSIIDPDAADSVERTWSSILDAIDECTLEGLTTERFLYYFWNSRDVPGSNADTIEQSRIRRSINDYLSDSLEQKETARTLVSDMSSATTTLRALGVVLTTNGQPEPWRALDESWRRDKYEKVSGLLYGILVTESIQPIPLLLALLKAYHLPRRGMTNQQLVRFLRAVERFQFRWTVSQKGSTSTIRRLYRVAAASVDSAAGSADYDKAFKTFVESASRIEATDNQFKDGLTRLSYSNTRAKDLYKIRYLLTRIEEMAGDTRLPLKHQMSIEHIEGQGKRSEVTPRNFWIFKIGNLTLLPPEVNAELPAKFKEKAPKISPWVRSSDETLTSAIATGDWDNATYNVRQEQLGQEALKIWPSLQSDLR